MFVHRPQDGLTEFLKAGYSGLNFAAAEGVESYHQLTDSFDRLDRGTAYQFLRTAMEMANHAAHVPFQEKSGKTACIFL